MAGHEREAVRALYREYREYLRAVAGFDAFDETEIAELPGQVFVWRDDHVVLGCVSLRELEPGIVEMKRLFVAAGARGRKGGRRLVEFARDEAGRQGYRLLRLDTLAAMREAAALYRDLGFREIGNYHGRELPPSYFFEWQLGGLK
jgi:putative acetyltransferase